MRKLASIAQITHIKPIEGADAIECAIVNDGWPVVVKKGEYQVNDLAVYLEIDSWVPHELAPFLSKGQYPRVYNGVEGERLKTVKLRGQISQGLLLPLSTLYDNQKQWTTVGEDVTEVLGIQKWEPNIPAQLQGTMKGQFPSYIPKTDQERCQNLRKEIFEEHKDETFEVTIKLDGSSMTVFVDNEGELCVCSRNINLKETEDNSFWKAARAQKLDLFLNKCYEYGNQYAIQGELIGEGIQGNPEKIQGQRFYLFDVYFINEGRYLSPWERTQFVEHMQQIGSDVEHVPVISTTFNPIKSLMKPTIEQLVADAEGPSMNPQTTREGLVFKSNESDFTFKAISNKYLLKHGDR